MKSIEVKVRPIPTSSLDKGSEKSLRGASRIYVSKEILFELTGTALENGKPCVIERNLDNGEVSKREASLWAAADTKLSRAVVQMSKAFQDACDIKLGDQVRIVYTHGKSTTEAEDVILEDITQDQADIKDEDLWFWERSMKGHLLGLDDVFPGLVLKRIFEDQVYRNFRVTVVNGSKTMNARYAPDTTTVRIRSAKQDDDKSTPARPARLKLDNIPGLERQIQDLNKILRLWSGPLRSSATPKSCGLVLHGGHGTGKTLLLNQISQTGWGTVHRIHPSDKLSSITETFQRARDKQPSIIVIDRFEQLIEKDRSNRNAVIQCIGEYLDKLVADTVAKNERPRVVVLAACLDYMTDVPSDLTDIGRFEKHIHLPLPDESRRRAIVSSVDLPLPPESKEEILTRLSERTHAYNGKDLMKLVGEASEMWEIKLGEMEDSGAVITSEDEYLPEQMLVQAMQTIRPSAMHDINLKPPPVHWDDIGGQDEVKKSLQEAISLATVPKDKLLWYTPNPPKGFLLYGPPGCSKTMAAQALATEADLNFFAVKGAELLNMYVGESERQIRQLFQRAREAAPSIIFFDEIDSIGGQRSGFGSSGSSSGASGGSGLNVLTTLLNEMQGFEQTQGVLVLAATNRPQALDPALLRPGRFDKLIYVRPPDEAAREAIFRKFKATRNAAPDVEVNELARETEGFSGAEIARICSDAGLKAWWRDAESEGEQGGIRMEDLRAEIRIAPRMITQEMLDTYEEWAKRFLKGAA